MIHTCEEEGGWQPYKRRKPSKAALRVRTGWLPSRMTLAVRRKFNVGYELFVTGSGDEKLDCHERSEKTE